MIDTDLEPALLSPAPTDAMTAATGNLSRNWHALAQQQADVLQAVSSVNLNGEWLFGCDGSLTLLSEWGWWSGSSLPLRTALALLQKMELKSAVVCFLSPTHAAQVRVTLDRMDPGQALLAIIPEVNDLHVMLGCDDFSGEIQTGRLWFAAGNDWATELERLLYTHDGMPLPGQFVRTLLTEKEPLEEMIHRAQEIFTREGSRRAGEIRSLYESTPINPNDICVVTPGRFRLWDDIGAITGAIAHQAGWKRIDPDEACSASPSAFARATAGCGAAIVVNVGRADLPSDLPAGTRVITWLTGPRIPAFDSKGSSDALLVCEPRWRTAAIAQGWPAERVAVAGWPHQTHQHPGEGLVVIADTTPINMPDFALSSHKVLWESMARELSNDPLAAGQDAAGYLARWLRQASIAEETVDQSCFIQRLIIPCYQQALVRWLIDAGIAFKLFGRGWEEMPEFAAFHQGQIKDRDQFEKAVENCGALVHLWPINWTHPIDAAGRAVLKISSKTRELWLSEAKRLASGRNRPAVVTLPAISADLIRRFVRD